MSRTKLLRVCPEVRVRPLSGANRSLLAYPKMHVSMQCTHPSLSLRLTRYALHVGVPTILSKHQVYPRLGSFLSCVLSTSSRTKLQSPPLRYCWFHPSRNHPSDATGLELISQCLQICFRRH